MILFITGATHTGKTRLAQKLMEKYKIKEIGIAVPGTIKGREIVKSVNLGVKNYKLVENIQKEIDLPIKIKNDAKCAAIAENEIGALKDYKRSIFLSGRKIWCVPD